MSRRARREKGTRHLWYGLGLVGAVAALVAIQVVPKLEQHDLVAGTSVPPVEAPANGSAKFAGSTWRLLGILPATADDLPKGITGVTAIISVTPGDQAAGRAMSEGCDASLRDGRDRTWGPSSKVHAKLGMTTLCTQIDKKTYKPIPATPGTETTWQAAFAVPADAVSSLRVEVRLPKTEGFVRLTPPAKPSAAPRPAG